MKTIFTKLQAFLLTALAPVSSNANRYFDDCEEGCKSGLPQFIESIVGGAICLAAYWFLYKSYCEWKNRKATKEKPISLEGLFDWCAALLGYIWVSMLLAIPVLFVIKKTGTPISFDDVLFVMAIFFATLFFFRRH